MYQYLELGGARIPLYNLMIGIGILCGVLFLDYRIKKEAPPRETELHLYFAVILSIIAGFAGAKVFHAAYMGRGLTLRGFLSGGMTYYGGLISGAAVFIACAAAGGGNILHMVSMVTPSLVLAHVWGRVGCFLGGCCFGKPARAIPGVVFPAGSIPYRHYGGSVAVYPVQLFESAFLSLLFLVMIKRTPPRLYVPVYMAWYGLFRFCAEFLRGDNRGTLWTGAPPPSGLISIPLAAAGVVLYGALKKGCERELK
ncbi:MAG: prolipoprotein diacylglyceryl transferase [Treponema sp.]|jgi:phosphatidylglycerol:prolipoprotein diacylglycerol transferase|nr:prolipoprotein diacylglyceryl transferase [Treponema sp.]